LRFALGGGVVEKTAYLPSPALVDDFYDDENATAARSRSRSRCTGGDETTWSLTARNDDTTRKNNTTTNTNNTNEFRRRRQREEGELASKALSNNDAFGGEGRYDFFPLFPLSFFNKKKKKTRYKKKEQRKKRRKSMMRRNNRNLLRSFSIYLSIHACSS